MPVMLMIALHSVFSFVYACARAYTVGLWFVLRHPVRFMDFLDLYGDYEERINDVRDAREAGYYNLNRKQRRSIR